MGLKADTTELFKKCSDWELDYSKMSRMKPR